MSKTIDSARLYARVAVLRRKVLLRHAVKRAVAGGVAVFAGLVALGFGTRVAYLALLPRFGDLCATAIVGGGYLVVASGCAIFALREPRSEELAALERMEIEAKVRARDAVDAIRLAGAQAEGAASKAMMVLGVINALRRAFRRRGV